MGGVVVVIVGFVGVVETDGLVGDTFGYSGFEAFELDVWGIGVQELATELVLVCDKVFAGPFTADPHLVTKEYAR